jgi:hypothetical protein
VDIDLERLELGRVDFWKNSTDFPVTVDCAEFRDLRSDCLQPIIKVIRPAVGRTSRQRSDPIRLAEFQTSQHLWGNRNVQVSDISPERLLVAVASTSKIESTSKKS